MKLVLSEDEISEVSLQLQTDIREFVEGSGATGIVCGLSGGLDSAVALKLAFEAGVNCKALLLPEDRLSSEDDILDAENLVKELKIEYDIIKIDSILDAVRTSSAVDADSKVWGNVKPRVRMTLLYLTANLEKRLVMGTGNRTEILLGYYTKYGDGGTDFFPIGDLYKTHVRQLAKHIGIPESIIQKPPAAGLWEGQTDEVELGLDYERIDRILYALVDKGDSVENIARDVGVSEEIVNSFKKRVDNNLHKCSVAPVFTLSL